MRGQQEKKNKGAGVKEVRGQQEKENEGAGVKEVGTNTTKGVEGEIYIYGRRRGI